MNTDERIPAKAISAEDQSDAVVVSFGAEWRGKLATQTFNIVIRKRVPSSSNFKWIYFHINSPVGAICARAPIRRIAYITRKAAVGAAKRIGLSAAEITSYIGSAPEIGAYEIGQVQCPIKPITTGDLASHLNYFPPQSFMIVSKAAKLIIDRLAGFERGGKKRAGGAKI